MKLKKKKNIKIIVIKLNEINDKINDNKNQHIFNRKRIIIKNFRQLNEMLVHRIIYLVNFF